MLKFRKVITLKKIVEIEYLDVEENSIYNDLIENVVQKCFEIENLLNTRFYISVTLTTPKNIKAFNKKYRNIDKETDVLSFPMFEKSDILQIQNSKMEFEDVLGDMIISIERVEQQAIEYGHSFERELAYMVVHSFYHLMGEDHMVEEDKACMRAKEEKVLNALNINR